MSFHVGQHVLCIDDEAHLGWNHRGVPNSYGRGTLDGLTRGTVYTVADIYTARPSGILALVVAEITRPPYAIPEMHERGFAAARFRPLSKRRLAIFRQHLAPSPTDKVDA